VKRRLAGIAAGALVLGLLVPTQALANPQAAPVCSVKSEASAKGIRSLYAEVRRADTGQVLFARRATQPARTASVMKLLTAVVALDTLGPDYRVTTTVYSDPETPGKIYLVGAGDVTLSRTPGNLPSYYSGGPKLDTLTKQITTWAKTNSVSISAVVTDSTLFGEQGDWHATWDKRGITQGYMGPVSALQVDAGRLTSRKTPNLFIGQRAQKPVQQAGTLFLSSLRKAGLATGAKVTAGKLPEGAVPIASVQSQPISKWIENTLRVSDNALSEALARLSSLKTGRDGSMESLTATYKEVLGARGLSVKTLAIVDGSGLSRLNKVPPVIVNKLLAQVYGDEAKHAAVISGMPVSGKSGSLRYRFNTGPQRPALYNVEAKTGWIRTGYSLAGKMRASDGTELIFTVYNLWNQVDSSHRIAMDNLVYGFYRCGSKLSNN
jgi:serine-type D-Ala-D-Ala carboxypeptidase/endopeptidase (penicillin-binding protein 4)